MKMSCRLLMLTLLGSCTVPGVVGDLSFCSHCEPAQQCDATTGRCVDCLANRDCMSADAAIESCTPGDDCREPRCIAGQCHCGTTDMICAAGACGDEACGDDEQVGQHGP